MPRLALFVVDGFEGGVGLDGGVGFEGVPLVPVEPVVVEEVSAVPPQLQRARPAARANARKIFRGRPRFRMI